MNIYKRARSLRSENNTTLVTPIVRTKSYGERGFDKAVVRTKFDIYLFIATPTVDMEDK